MSKNGKLNVYEMYIANGYKAGFFVHREGWGLGTAAKVISVSGRTEGEAALSGAAPYFDNPVVMMEVAYENARSRVAHLGVLRSPGTYRYLRIDKPEWWP